MRLIVDCDPLVYGMGFAAQGEPYVHALNLVKIQLQRYMEFFGSKDISAHLTGSREDQWRPQLYPSYKADRLTAQKPEHYDAIRDYLVTHWNAQVSDGIEADDAVCLEAYEYKQYSLGHIDEECEEFDQIAPTCVMVSVDKDLDQCPGWHFKPGTISRPKDWYYYINRETAALWWGCQMLMGDPGDDIVGIPNIGKAKAKRFMLELPTDQYDYDSISAHVLNVYKDYHLDEADFVKTKELVSMIQDKDDYDRLLRSIEEAANSQPVLAGA